MYARGLSGMPNAGELEEPLIAISGGVRSMSAGTRHTLVVMEDGSLWSFGSNHAGELGTGSILNSSSPQRIFEDGVVAAYAGHNLSFVIKEDGSAWGFGSNDYGQLGIGSTESRLAPVEVFSSGVEKIATGTFFSLFVLEDGSMWGAGSNEHSQLGVIDVDRIETPIEVKRPVVVNLSGSYQESVFSMGDGSLWAFNQGMPGEPIRLQLLPSPVAELFGYYDTVYARLENGALWGGYSGLGNRSIPWSTRLERLVTGGVVDVGGYRDELLVLREDGSVWMIDGWLEAPTKIVEGSGDWENDQPIAELGPDIVAVAGEGRESLSVVVSASRSRDDWLIASWEWEYDDRIWESNDPFMRKTFPLGESEVFLTVRDFEGLESMDTVKVTVLSYSVFADWLREFFNEENILEWGQSAGDQDPDRDGISNLQEMIYGLNPTLALDPILEMETRSRSSDEGLVLESRPGIEGLQYSIWESDDLIHWRETDADSEVVEGVQRFFIQSPSGYYRIGVDE